MNLKRSSYSLLWLALGVFLISFNLRTLFTSLSAILPEVIAATGLSEAQASILTTLPVLCLGIFAIPAPLMARKFGTEKALLIALFFIALGTLLRSTPYAFLLFVGTALAGAGIAVCNVLLPGLIKRDFGTWAAAMTGVFTMGLCLGAAVAAATTQPVWQSYGESVYIAMAVWTAPAILTTILWIPETLKQKKILKGNSIRPGGLWHDRLAWQVSLFMGLQSALAYIMMGWLAPMLRDRGMDAASAGYVVAISITAQMLATLVTPSFAVRFRSQSWVAVGLSLLTILSFVACLALPLTSVWIWSFLLGIAQGGTISLAILLIVLRSGEPLITAQLSGMAQGIGYTIAAAGPLTVGILKDYSGNFSSSIALIVFIGTIQTICGYGAGRKLLVSPKIRA